MYLLQFFVYSELPANLKEVAKPYCDIAQYIVQNLPDNPERTTALRKLLESRDSALRAEVFGNG